VGGHEDGNDIGEETQYPKGGPTVVDVEKPGMDRGPD
jgi:hypothetical protein